MPVFHRPECSQTQPPSIWLGQSESMQTCPECQRNAPAEAGAALTGERQQRELPAIPSTPRRARTGWPTHRARARGRVSRRKQKQRQDAASRRREVDR